MDNEVEYITIIAQVSAQRRIAYLKKCCTFARRHHFSNFETRIRSLALHQLMSAQHNCKHFADSRISFASLSPIATSANFGLLLNCFLPCTIIRLFKLTMQRYETLSMRTILLSQNTYVT